MHDIVIGLFVYRYAFGLPGCNRTSANVSHDLVEGRAAMSAATAPKPIVHFVGSIPLPDAETVFRTLAASAAPHLKRLPDGETGIRKTWIRFLQQVLADNPAIEVASDVPAFKFTQWDGTLLREIPRLRVKPGARLDPRPSQPAMPIWLSSPGDCSTVCSRTA